MDIKDSYLHSAIGVVKSIEVGDGELTYKLADVGNTSRTFDLTKAASIPFIVGTLKPSTPNSNWVTGTWTGEAPTIKSLYDGLTIRYWLPYNGSGDATLNLKLSDGTYTGNLECFYRGTTRLTTHISAGTPITLTYRENPIIKGSTYEKKGWWMDGDFDSDSGLYRSYSAKAFKTGTSDILAYNLIGVDKDGLLVPALTTPFLVNGPLYIRISSLTKNKEFSWANLWERSNSITIKNGSTNLSLITYKPLYLKGEINNGLFTAIEYTQVLPTTEDGKAYLYIGEAVNSTSISFSFVHPIYIYKGGTIQTYSGYSTLSSRATLADTVSCTAGSSDAYRPIVVTNQSNGLYYNSNITANYKTGDLKATTFTGKLVYTNLTGSTTTANQAIVSSGTANGWTLKTLGSNAFNSTAYLPLSGGTMTGSIVMPSGTYIYSVNESGGAMLMFDGTKTVLGSIGDTSTGYTHIRSKEAKVTVGAGNTASYTLLHTGNYSTTLDERYYTESEIDTKLGNYVTIDTTLTITGSKRFNNIVNINTNTNSTPLKISRLGSDAECLSIGLDDATTYFHYKNDELGANFKFIGEWTNTGDNGNGVSPGSNFVLFVFSKDSTKILLNDGARTHTVLHSGIAYIENGKITINGTSITPLTSHLSLANYVTLDGTQTITGAKTFTASTNVFKGEGAGMLTVNRNSTNPAWIKFMKDTTIVGYLGIRNDGTPTYGNSEGTSYVLLHSGNYTSYLGYIGTTAVQSSSKAQELTGITKLTFNSSSNSYIGTTSGGYVSINSHDNEICISGTKEDMLYINYRKGPNGKAPETWRWKAGSSTSWANFELGNLTSSGLTTTKTLKISSTEAESHIAFSRGSHNYITTPSGGNIHIVPNGGSISSTAGFIFGGSSLYPGVTNTRSLGTSDLRWTNVYSVAGNYTGNITASKFITSGGTSNLFVKGDGSLDDSYYKYCNAYNFQNGYLVKLDITDNVNRMCNIHITGNSYTKGTPINTYLEFYAYYNENSTLLCRAIHYGLNFGNIEVFLYNKNYYLWFLLLSNYTSFSVYANISNNDKTIANAVISITNEAMPTEGISRHVTIIPKVSNETLYIEGIGTSEGVWLGEHERITKYYTGLTILYKIPIAGNSNGVTLNINNLGAKSCKWGYNKLTTHYGKNNVILFVYDGVNFVTPGNYNWCPLVNQYKTDEIDVNYPILFRYSSTEPTNGSYVGELTRYDSSITINPSTNTVKADKFQGSLFTLSTSNLNSTWKPGRVLAWFTNVSHDNNYAGDNTGFPASNNANGILWLGTHSGSTEDVLGYGHQLGFSSNKRIYHRSVTDTLPTTANGGSWFKIAYTTDNFPSNQINALTGYSKATSAANLATTDSLNTALGKLEYKADLGVSAYNWYQSVTGTDTDNIINKWDEIVDFVNNITTNNDLTDEFVTRKTAQTITGAKTFTATTNTFGGGDSATYLTVDRNSTNPAYVCFKKNGNLVGYLGVSNDKIPVFNDGNGPKTILHSGNYSTTLDGRYYTETEVNNLLKKYLPLAGGTMTLGEGLKFHSDENYFGTNADARIISLLDGNGTTCDGGLIIDERATNNGVETITELLRIRDAEFKWRGNNILHVGNYTDYTVKKDGTGASGTWGINVTGNAATATKLATARKFTIGDTEKSFDGTLDLSWTSSEIGYRHEWRALVKCATWSRLCYVVYGHTTTGSSYIINIKGTRNSVVYNYTYLVTTHHGEKSNIVQIGGSNYSNISVRACVNTSGTSYFELYDTARDATSATTQYVNCTLIPISCGKITKYIDTFTDGTTLTEGFIAGTLLDSKAYVNSIQATNFVGNLIGNVTGNITGLATSATKVYVNNHTTNNVEYPLVWTNLVNAENKLENQLFKSYNKLTYNPSTNTITATIFKGNATSATKLATARTIWGLSFDGSADITGDLIIDASNDVNRYITFDSNGNGYDWRIGYLGSGSGDANYFVLENNGSDGKSWLRALQIGLTSLTSTFGGNVVPKANDTQTLGTSSLKWKNVYATTFTGNATSASKWATARTITLGGLLQGSVSMDGSKNVDLSGYNYWSNVSIGGTNLYPYHRIISLETPISSTHQDAYGLFRITLGYNDGYLGILRVSIKTNSGSSKSVLLLEWVYRKGFALNSIQAGFNDVLGNTYVDIFYKSPGAWAGIIVELISNTKARAVIGRGFTLISSKEIADYVDSTYLVNTSKTTSFNEISSENTSADGNTTLRTYTGIQQSTDANITVGSANKVNSTLTFAAGSFAAKTFNGSSAVTVNVPTKTSHLTNDSGYLTSRGYIGTTAVQASSANQSLTGITNLTISATNSESYIKFSRAKTDSDSYGLNYILAPTNGLLALGVGFNASNYITAIIDSASVRPYATDTKNLGTSSIRWKNVYATTFNGNLTGNVTGNLTGNATSATKINIQNIGTLDMNTMHGDDYRGTVWYGGGGNSAVNNPVGDTLAFGMLIWRNASGYTAQLIMDSSAKLRVRLYTGSAWSALKTFAFITDITKSQVGLGNVQNTAFYLRKTNVNGEDWNMAGTTNSAAFTIYAPTTAGTAGQVLVSSGSGAPTWGTNVASSLNNIELFSGSVSVSSGGWTDLGTGTSVVKFTSIDTGTYAIQVVSGTNFVASGVFSVYKNLSNVSDEIPLHVCTSKSTRIYLRTNENKLLIASNDTSATSWNVTIKIAKIL